MTAMLLVINPGNWKYVYGVLRHASWNGCTFADVIYPFFLFIVGVSIGLALSKAKSGNVSRKPLYLKIFRRTVILFILGLFLNTFPDFDLVNIRIMGVLQRIAICYLIVSILFLNTDIKLQGIIAVSLLFIYWALMAWIPVPEVGAGHYEKYGNFARYIDTILLKGHMGYYEKMGEPEGIISTLTSLSSTLFGLLVGQLLIFKKSKMQVFKLLLICGAILLVVGLIWGIFLPINKHLWTSSYAVLTTGLAVLVLSILFYLIDIKKYQRKFQPFLVFGTNAITVYVLSIVLARLIKMAIFTLKSGTEYHIRSWLYDFVLAPALGNYNGSVAWALLYILFWYGIMLIFYKRKIFIKI